MIIAECFLYTFFVHWASLVSVVASVIRQVVGETESTLGESGLCRSQRDPGQYSTAPQLYSL